MFDNAVDDAIVEFRTEINKTRIRFSKEELLAHFEQSSELDFSIFEKDALLENAEIFNASSDGLGRLPETFLADPEHKPHIIAAN